MPNAGWSARSARKIGVPVRKALTESLDGRISMLRTFALIVVAVLVEGGGCGRTAL